MASPARTRIDLAGPQSADPVISDAVLALARRGLPRTLRKGTLLIREGELGDTLYVILAGRLRVFGADPSSGRELTYGIYGPGEYLGEMGLDGQPRSASVVALEACRVAVVTRTTLEAHIAEHPEFAFDLLAKVIRRARAATVSAKQLALNDVYGRLKMLLEDAALPRPDGTRELLEAWSHREISQRIGCTREMVSRVLKDLERGGYVSGGDGAPLRLLRALPARW